MSKVFQPNAVNIPKPIAGKLDAASSSPLKKAGAQGSSVKVGDEVETGVHSRLHALAMAVGEYDRTSHLEELRGLVQSGNYRLDPAALSDAILDSMRRDN